MALQCGIVGLPNVGKSTLFNAISNNKAEAANFPFCTIEPNVGVISVPDNRLKILEGLVSPERVIPTSIEFVDIAGLVKGASKGEGLGNQFLANIREVDAIIHVIRCFENDNIVHVDGRVDPIADKEIIDTELQLKDLDGIEKRILKTEKTAKSGDAAAKKELALLKQIQAEDPEPRLGRAAQRGPDPAGADPCRGGQQRRGQRGRREKRRERCARRGRQKRCRRGALWEVLSP